MSEEEELRIHRELAELLFERDMRAAGRRRIQLNGRARIWNCSADVGYVLTPKGRDYQLTQ